MTKRYSKILVTGGAGFIGSHIVDRLLEEDFEVIVIDNLEFGKMENIAHHQNEKNFHFVRGDIRNWQFVNETMKDVDAVFHEAALASVALSVQDPILTNEVNVSGTLHLLKAAADLGVKRFVYASSAAVYGETRTPEKREDEASSPKSPYGVSKLAAEKYAKSFFEVYGLETVSLRYFNVYGPRQSVDLKGQYGSVITIFLSRLLRNMSPIIFGDGEQTRDFVYVKDVAQANVLAMTSKNAVGECFNIGTGTRISVNQVAQVLKSLINKKEIKNVYADPRPGDIRHGYADISKAKRMLNYIPKFSFEKGIADLVKWYNSQQDPST
jgi:UDP-glucose 4-epimerase